MESLDRDILFVALTRPQMLFGVTFSFFIVNAIITTELFLIFKSIWVVLAALGIHVAGWLGSLREPRLFELWIVKAQRCPRLRSYKTWGCNSYRP